MLSSIPLIAPRDAHTLWYTPSSTFTPALPPSYTAHAAPSLPSSQNIHPSALPHRHQQQQHQQQQQQLRPRAPTISPLTQLALDEQSLHQRKVHIQRFGATWIKPPGIHKTYQGELDDKAEREEAERQAMMEDDGAAEDEVFDDEDGEGVVGRGAVAAAADDDGEVDLDAGIPEVDSLLSDDDEEEEELSEDDEDDDDDEDEDEAGGEVDLDAGVPEADAVWEDSDEEEDDDEDEEEEEFDYDEDDEDEEEETQHTAGIESSPHQAMYSHDEHFGPPDSRVEQRLRAYPRRSLVRSDDEMEVDSDN